jgi:hypothetical protein
MLENEHHKKIKDKCCDQSHNPRGFSNAGTRRRELRHPEVQNFCVRPSSVTKIFAALMSQWAEQLKGITKRFQAGSQAPQISKENPLLSVTAVLDKAVKIGAYPDRREEGPSEKKTRL